MMPPGMWAVVQTETMREAAVRDLLERDDRHECYLPLIKQQGRTVALFPGYIFVTGFARWYPIAWTPHVVRLLMAGDRPAMLEDSIVSEIRKRERGGLVTLPQPPRLKRGQAVRVTRGSFEGKIGIYDGMTGRDRERVLLELLGRQVRIELAGNAVEPLS